MSKLKLVAKATFMNSSSIAHQIEEIDQKLSDTAAAIEELHQQRDALVLEGDVDALDAHDTRARKLALKVETLQAKRPTLVAEQRAAEREEDQASRRKAYTRGQRLVVEHKAILSDYEKAARALSAVLDRLAAAKAEIAAINKALPEGADPLPDPEAFRQPPAHLFEPSKISGTKNLMVQVGEDVQGRPLFERRQERWEAREPGWRPPAATPSLVGLHLPGVAYRAPPIR